MRALHPDFRPPSPYTGTGLRTWVVTSAAEMTRLRGRWQELAKEQSIFQSFLWSQTAAWIFAARERPHVVIAESGSGMAILPAVMRELDMGFIGEELFDYRDMLATGDSDALHCALGKLATASRVLTVKAIRGAERAAAWQGLPIRFFADAPYVSTSELTAEGLGARHRKLGRLSRRLRRGGVNLRRHSGTDGALVRAIYERKAAQTNGSPSLFTDPLRREFMLTICALEPGCEVFTYESDTELVAALVTFRHEQTRHFYTIYYDPAFRAESPGQLLLFEVAALTLEDGLTCDFMTGSSPYKDRLATGRVPLYAVECSTEQLSAFAAI